MGKLTFSKYSGCGNDFILIDHRSPFLNVSKELVLRLCQRQTGIGADGLILLEKSSSQDFKMRIFNADGSEAEMCGNGIRCLGAFLLELGYPKQAYTIETMERKLSLEFTEKGIKVAMGDPKDIRSHVPLEIEGQNLLCYTLDTGVPHAVVFVDDVEKVHVVALGQKIRYHTSFLPKGTNANFVEKDSPRQISIRTYERGVEDETLACGTGATASALAAALQWNLKAPITVKTRSQDSLEIDFVKNQDQTFTQVSQTGPAHKTFSGTIDL